MVEIPLLFEANLHHGYDATIAVIADEDKCVDRFCMNGKHEKDYFNRSLRHLSPDKKAKMAIYIIENNGNLAQLKDKVTLLYQLLT